MALHDFYCPACGYVWTNYDVPVAVGATAGAPTCPGTWHDAVRMVWIPAAPAVHYGSVKTAGFKAFDTTDGRGHPVHVDSLRKLRQVERDSEQAYRNGEGQPMVFRRWAQDASNADQPTLSRSYYGGEAPTPEAARRFGPTIRRSLEEPTAEFGPGVSEANASALPLVGKE